MPRESLGPRYAKVWSASAISLAGDGFILAAMPLLIATTTSSAASVSGLEVARGIPWLFFGLFGGVVADRLDRRRVMALVDSLRCIAVGLLAVAAWQHDVSVGLIWIVAFLLGSGEVFFDNAAQSILPSLVETEQIERANARFSVTENVARDLAGPAIGAALFAWAASLPFALDSASFLAASLIVFTLRGTYSARPRSRQHQSSRRARYQERSRRRREEPSIREDLREGLQFLRGHELLRSLLLLGCAYNFLIVGAEAINVLFALRVLHMSKSVYGLVLTAAAVGGIGAGLIADRVIKRLGPGGTLLTVFPLASIAGILAGTTNSVFVFMLAVAVSLGCGTFANIVIITLRQTLVPDALLGRVNSLFRVGLATAAPVGALVAGQLAGLVSLRAPLLLMGIGCGALAVAAGPLVNNAAIEQAKADAAAEFGPDPGSELDPG
ncbi:MAG TPA: MFS transporter [Acidimicrobiia bacterium]|nr:MFS transporter [Acidimicrobiia bacterium]